MKKIVFEGEESSILLFKNEKQIEIEMIDNSANRAYLQIGDSYNNISLNKEDAIDLANELLKLSNDTKE